MNLAALARHLAIGGTGETRLLVTLSVVIGIGAGLGGLRLPLADRRRSPRLLGPDRPLLPWGPLATVPIPTAGGALVGPLVYVLAREARGHGVPEVMLALAEERGRIRFRVVFVKALASALCIGSGGSAGREGPIVQIGAALGSARRSPGWSSPSKCCCGSSRPGRSRSWCWRR